MSSLGERGGGGVTLDFHASRESSEASALSQQLDGIRRREVKVYVL